MCVLKFIYRNIYLKSVNIYVYKLEILWFSVGIENFKSFIIYVGLGIEMRLLFQELCLVLKLSFYYFQGKILIVSMVVKVNVLKYYYR